MASNPLFIIDFFFAFSKRTLLWLPMDHCSGSWATLGLKEMGKFLWEGREKGQN